MGKKLTGMQFGRLTVIGEAPTRRKNHAYWLCRCSCGKEKEVGEDHLKNGHTKSCGCYRRELSGRKKRDLEGQRFGRLTVLKEIKLEGRDGIFAECLCDCGNRIVCRKENLYTGNTKSCGCLQAETRKENMEKAIHFVDGTCVERIASHVISSNNTSGHRGVYRRGNNRWRASIGFRGKLYNLGSFEKFEDAVNARLKAEQEMYDPFLSRYREQNGR